MRLVTNPQILSAIFAQIGAGENGQGITLRALLFSFIIFDLKHCQMICFALLE
jgi:hypothetical protein